MTIALITLGVIALAGWVNQYRLMIGRIDVAFSAGRKLGRASAFLSQGQIDNMLIEAGIDPTRLPGRNA